MTGSIKVAISGGGLAGASLVHALLKYPHLDIHIFESASEFKEAGSAIGLKRSAQAALDLIGPSAVRSFQDAGGVEQLRVRFMLAQGDHAGSLIAEDSPRLPGQRMTAMVPRAAFLRQLLASVPPERMHTSKKLERVERAGGEGGSLALHFADGSSHECDVLVGADGIHSIVRKMILGDGDPAAHPRNAGWWAVMVMKPHEEVRACLGDDYVDANDPSEYEWIGDGNCVIHHVLGGTVLFIVAVRDEAAVGSEQWHRKVDAEEIRKLHAGWPAHLRRAVDKLLCDKNGQPALYLWDHHPARTYVSGPVCVVGDAAHAMTPWQGSGAGMSIEDSLVLSTLLGRATTPTEVLKALEVYDQVRRPRTQQIVASSKETGLVSTGRGEETGLDLEKLQKQLLPRWDFILNFDVEKHLADALKLMAEKVGH
ncbi:salicylate hydroxylase [Apiospora arundinis]